MKIYFVIIWIKTLSNKYKLKKKNCKQFTLDLKKNLREYKYILLWLERGKQGKHFFLCLSQSYRPDHHMNGIKRMKELLKKWYLTNQFSFTQT